MTDMSISKDESQVNESANALSELLLSYYNYKPLMTYVTNQLKLDNQRLQRTIQLAQAIITVDLDTISTLAKPLERTYLLKPSYMQRRVYAYAQYMQVQFKRGDYMDYIRALSPILVDVYRLMIERDFLPNLNHYMEPVVKLNEQGAAIYKGLHWKESVVERHPNKVQETFTTYYGGNFNYDHYVASSHLLYLIDDHAQQEEMKQVARQLRHVEKFIRNIVAHEVIHVDDRLVRQRTGYSLEEIHALLKQALSLAGLTDERQWRILKDLNTDILKLLKDHSKE